MSDTKLVWLLSGDDGDEPEGAERLERVPLDTDGLGDVLDGFGFREDLPGVGTLWHGGPPPAQPYGELQRLTRRHLPFERSTPGIEIVAYVHRVPGLTREEFQVRYRSLGLRLRSWAGPAQLMCRYAQNHVIGGDDDGPDGISELGFASADDLRRFILDPWLPDTLLPYEAEFLDHARSLQMLVRRPSGAPAPLPLATAAAEM